MPPWSPEPVAPVTRDAARPVAFPYLIESGAVLRFVLTDHDDTVKIAQQSEQKGLAVTEFVPQPFQDSNRGPAVAARPTSRWGR
jgi:hypothetical protein